MKTNNEILINIIVSLIIGIAASILAIKLDKYLEDISTSYVVIIAILLLVLSFAIYHIPKLLKWLYPIRDEAYALTVVFSFCTTIVILSIVSLVIVGHIKYSTATDLLYRMGPILGLIGFGSMLIVKGALMISGIKNITITTTGLLYPFCFFFVSLFAFAVNPYPPNKVNPYSIISLVTGSGILSYSMGYLKSMFEKLK